LEDRFLVDNMVIYIEKEITPNFSFNSIIDELKYMKDEGQFFVYV